MATKPYNPNVTNVIIINGTGGSGKSTFCTYCREFASEERMKGKFYGGRLLPSVVELSTIDYVKSIATSTGWDGKKDDRGRAYLSALKDAMEAYDHIPSRRVMDSIKRAAKQVEHVQSFTYLFFVNIREPDNIAFFTDLCESEGYPCHSMILTNPSVAPIQTNHADKNVNAYDYNYGVVNSGTLDELKNVARSFLLCTLGYARATGD